MLITTDGSSRSRRVLPFAAEFAQAAGARVSLLQVLDPKDHEGEIDAAVKKTREELIATLHRASLEAEALVDVLRKDESVADAVLRVSEETGATLIAMDTRGSGAIRHALLGSVALDVLGRTRRPMMLAGESVGEPPQRRDVYRLLMTSDGSPASEDVVTALAPLLTPARFAVTLLRVHELPPEGEGEAEELRQAEAQLQALAALLPAGLEVETFVREIPRMGGIDTAIIEEALRREADAIALSTHGRSALSHVVAGSTAMLLLGRSPLPLILERALD